MRLISSTEQLAFPLNTFHCKSRLNTSPSTIILLFSSFKRLKNTQILSIAFSWTITSSSSNNAYSYPDLDFTNDSSHLSFFSLISITETFCDLKLPSSNVSPSFKTNTLYFFSNCSTFLYI